MQSQTRRIAERDISTPADDYMVVGRDEPDRPGFGARIAYAVQALLVIVIAVLSFAVFWVVGLLLNIF